MWNAVSAVFVNDLRNCALSEGQKSVEVYKAAESNCKTPESNSAGLVLPIGLFDNLLVAGGFISDG